ncbi:MAG TPA: glucose 1-dehydrogenase [Candidatus Limnocylindrales bacterium]|nr:glucose 1-dehydrogenase [Candidatus Limnocylindrales bacterium]
MRAATVRPGVADSLEVRDVERPGLDDVAGGRGVLVRVVRVGLCGTDKEINAAEFGEPPPGDDVLVLGHENLGRVEAVGPNVPSTIKPGGLVVATVRRPGSSVYDQIGLQDMSTADDFVERGIRRAHGFLAEYYVEDATFLVSLPGSLASVGVLLEPTSIVEKGIRQAFEIQRRLHVWDPQRAAVLGAGPIGLLTALILRLRAIDVTVLSRREAPYLNSDLVESIGGRYKSTRSTTLAEASAKDGPFDVILESTGYSPLVFEAADVLARDGVLVLASVTGGDRTAEVPADHINQGFVLGNKVMVGTVNSHHDDFEEGVQDMLRAEAFYPGWLERLLTTRIDGLDRAAILDFLRDDRGAIKGFVQVAPDGSSGPTPPGG